MRLKDDLFSSNLWVLFKKLFYLHKFCEDTSQIIHFSSDKQSIQGRQFLLFIHQQKKKKYHLQKYLSLNIHPPLVLQRMSEMRAHTSLLGRNSSSVGWSFKPETHSTNRSQWGAPPGNQAGYLCECEELPASPKSICHSLVEAWVTWAA